MRYLLIGHEGYETKFHLNTSKSPQLNAHINVYDK